MHSLYFVLLPKDRASTSKKAREYALNTLEQGGFFNQEGLRSGGKGDWGVVGGRWSGVLSNKHHEERDTYATNGAEDDAIIVTKKFIKQLKDKRSEVEVYDDEECEEKTIEMLDDVDIGKWIVVIDYHN